MKPTAFFPEPLFLLHSREDAKAPPVNVKGANIVPRNLFLRAKGNVHIREVDARHLWLMGSLGIVGCRYHAIAKLG
jgi:hypothetical protein